MATDTANGNGRHKAAIRRENEAIILQAAEELFAEFGLKGATMDRIAKRAGVPKANVHYYFSTKNDLYQRLIEDICDQWLQAAMVFDQETDPATALSGYISAKMDQSRARPHGSKVWANEIISGAQFTHDYIAGHVREWLEGRELVIRRWIAEGKMDPIEPRPLMFMIWAITQHFADFGRQIEILNDDKPLDDEAFESAKETVTRVILKGVGVA
ncbi:TetR/AcrR family transcriptional regulator [Aestuariispira insulae]|uniref:TetR family transcriptional regulator n=1 Tax=Aestuariispira insulae TaxID=1461337 RepID=A0A3D9HMV1_9PROT|nr:TetR/AcrR family transcriptional regulator [Aestuariispira insulae]RED50832.1 TetR family transcriptional regulator [Aestuariispira insulae]